VFADNWSLMGSLVYVAKQCLNDSLITLIYNLWSWITCEILKGTINRRIWVLIFSPFRRNISVSAVEPIGVPYFLFHDWGFWLVKSLMLCLIIRSVTWVVVPWLIIISVFDNDQFLNSNWRKNISLIEIDEQIIN